MFTLPLHRNGSSSIVACVFISAGTCLPSPCLEMNVYSGSDILAFRRHVTILLSVVGFQILTAVTIKGEVTSRKTLLVLRY
jgi:hypothetical protein